MTFGAGQYDGEASALKKATQAEGVVLLIVDGIRGSGLCVQAPLDVLLALPAALRDAAAEIEQDLQRLRDAAP
jgi:hypothetical protein